MTRVNMVQIEFNEINNKNNNIHILLFFHLNNKYLKYINNATTFLSCKISCKMTMPH
jgi:hypothetical protein